MSFKYDYKILETGISLSYFKITDMGINPIRNRTRVKLGAFIDENSTTHVLMWDFTFDGQLSEADCENLIKARPEFGGPQPEIPSVEDPAPIDPTPPPADDTTPPETTDQGQE